MTVLPGKIYLLGSARDNAARLGEASRVSRSAPFPGQNYLPLGLELTYKSSPCLCRTFDQASPNGIAVGSQVDLSDLIIKSERQDFGAPANTDDAEADE